MQLASFVGPPDNLHDASGCSMAPGGISHGRRLIGELPRLTNAHVDDTEALGHATENREHPLHARGILLRQEFLTNGGGRVRPTRRIRIVGHGQNIRVSAAGDWESEPLDGLREACRVATALDKLTRESVRRARGAGHSWAQIGQALDVTKQTAWERYSGEN